MDYAFWFAMHGGIRWLIVVMLVATLVKFAYGMLRGQAFGAVDARLLRIDNILLGIQFLLGIVVIFWRSSLGSMPSDRWTHMLIMILAVGLGGLTSVRARKANGDKAKYLTGLIGIGIVSILIFIGVSIVGGW